jgi:hypothetical protein
MKPEEGWRYNAYLQRWEVLKFNLQVLLHLVGEVKVKLLLRDRVLWYQRGVQDLEEALVFQHGKVLLGQNPNVKPGKPLELRTLLGVVRLGVSGKERLPFGRKLGVELSAGMAEVLEVYRQVIHQQAGEVKALARYVMEEVEALRLVTMGPLVALALDELRAYDRPLLREMDPEEPRHPSGAILPVEERWALVWEDVEEDAETARRVREDPEGWQPLSVDRLLGGRSWSELWQDLGSEEGASTP